MDFIAQLVGVIADAFFKALLEHLPQLVSAWKSASTSTMQNAPTEPKDVTDALEQEVNDAIHAGTMPGPGAVVHP